MSVLDKLKRKKKDEVRIPADIPMEVPTSLPSDLEVFKPQPDTPRTDYYDKSLEIPKAELNEDKIELILQKLDTIDTRLKLIEEKIKRY